MSVCCDPATPACGSTVFSCETKALLSSWALQGGHALFVLLRALYRLVSLLPGVAAIEFWILAHFLLLMRWHMDGYWTRYSKNIWLPGPANIAQDTVYVMQGIAPIATIEYGAHPREFFHVVRAATPTSVYAGVADGFGTPVPCALVEPQPDKIVFYVHGGGFVCASSANLVHSITMFARRGFVVYSAEYPLAPDDPYPAALVSVLRGLHFLHTVKRVQCVQLFGDSAGATLVTMAAAMIHNPPLMRVLAADTGLPLLTWSFPRIERLVRRPTAGFATYGGLAR
jgi:hypothetical protein